MTPPKTRSPHIDGNRARAGRNDEVQQTANRNDPRGEQVPGDGVRLLHADCRDAIPVRLKGIVDHKLKLTAVFVADTVAQHLAASQIGWGAA